jgi:hypothetical protein
MLAGETAIFAANAQGVSFLWLNVVGCVATVATGLIVSTFTTRRSANA